MSPIRVVLVGGADMLQDVVRQLIADDPALELVGESATIEGLPALWDRVEADVVIIRPLSAETPAWVLPAGAGVHIPAVLGLDPRGTRGVIVLNDVLAVRTRVGHTRCRHAARPRGSELTMRRAYGTAGVELQRPVPQLGAQPADPPTGRYG